MNIAKLTKIDQAPDTGKYLIYTRQEVLFGDYSAKKDVMDIVAASDILEMHLFDACKEYRMIITESKRYPEGVIEHVVSEKEEDYFIDKTMIDGNRADTLEVINYITYTSKSGMASIDDYRLRMGGNR